MLPRDCMRDFHVNTQVTNRHLNSCPDLRGDYMAPALQQENAPTSSAPPSRLDEKLHQILYKPEARAVLEQKAELEVLPEPPYPIHPDPQPMTKSEYQKLNALRTSKTWSSPSFKSR